MGNEEVNRVLYKYINGKMWCSIPGYSKYFANKEGEILGVRGQVLKEYVNKYGYCVVPAVNNSGLRKNPLVHRLVAKCFIYNKHPNVKTQIDHLDGVKHNNNYTNLEWVSNQENQIRAIKNKLNNPNYGEEHHMSLLTNKQVIDIYMSYDTHANLSKKYNVSQSNIYDIRNGNIWTKTTSELNNDTQRKWLKYGIRGQTIESVKEIYTSEGMYKDIAKRFNTSVNTISKIKNDEICKVFTADLTPHKNKALINSEDAKKIYTSNETFKELADKYNVSTNYIENIKNGHSFKEFTRGLDKGDSTRRRKITHDEIIYIYTSRKSVLELSKEMDIKKSTVNAIKTQQNHKKITENLKKGGL